MPVDLKSHPTAELFPLLSDDDLANLAKDIAANGLREPIWTWQGAIIDGRNRFLACTRAKVEPRFREWDGKGSLVAFVWSLNGERRHLTAGQKAAVAVEMLPLLEAEAAQRQAATRAQPGEKIGSKATEKIQPPTGKGMAAQRAAEITGTNAHYVADAKKLKQQSPELFAAVKSGKRSLVEVKRQVREAKREARRDENRRKVATAPAVDVLASGARFSTIVIDPPWDWGDEGDVNQLGRARPDYATMSMEQLLALPVAKLSDDDCHLYLWITNRSLPKGFGLLERWGFRYITAITWAKPSFGMGNYFRGQTEHVLFAVKGSMLLKRRDASTLLHADRGKGHSGKPPAFLEFVESCSPGPYLEMFSRSERAGWVTWGEASGAAA